VSEIGGAQPPWLVPLCEENLTRRPLGQSPDLDSALQCSQLSVSEAAGMILLQSRKQASLYFFSIAYLAAKIVSWDEATRHIAGIRCAISILVLLGANGIFAASLKWINVRSSRHRNQQSKRRAIRCLPAPEIVATVHAE
jgi:hypothetical protein